MIAKILALCFVGLLSLVLVSTYLQHSCFYYDEVMTDGNFTIKLCRTGSMCGLSFAGWYAITPQDISEIHVGDLILFQKLSSTIGIAHRVVRIDGEWITTKGDCNSADDQSIPFENVAYKIVQE